MMDGRRGVGISFDRSEGGRAPGIVDCLVRNPLEPRIEPTGPMCGEGVTAIDTIMLITAPPPPAFKNMEVNENIIRSEEKKVE